MGNGPSKVEEPPRKIDFQRLFPPQYAEPVTAGRRRKTKTENRKKARFLLYIIITRLQERPTNRRSKHVLGSPLFRGCTPPLLQHGNASHYISQDMTRLCKFVTELTLIEDLLRLQELVQTAFAAACAYITYQGLKRLQEKRKGDRGDAAFR